MHARNSVSASQTGVLVLKARHERVSGGRGDTMRHETFIQNATGIFTLLSRLINYRVILLLEELGQLKIPLTPPGVETTIYQLVAHCLKQLLHRMPSVSCPI
jgi:hypothetical protein